MIEAVKRWLVLVENSDSMRAKIGTQSEWEVF